MPVFIHILGSPLLALGDSQCHSQKHLYKPKSHVSHLLKALHYLPTALRLRSKLLTVRFQDLGPAPLSRSSRAASSLAARLQAHWYQVLQ